MGQFDLVDVGHEWGSDLQLSPTGDLAAVTGATRSQQRVLRRLLTNPGDYMMHPDYGAGCPRFVGQNLNIREITALIRGQMALEASVQQDPGPEITITQTTYGVSVYIKYIVPPDAVPAQLRFETGV